MTLSDAQLDRYARHIVLKEIGGEGQRAGKLDMTVPFLIQVNASGNIDRLVVEKFGCDKAEGLLAGALLKLLDRGGYRPKGGMHEGWFRGDVSFAHS